MQTSDHFEIEKKLEYEFRSKQLLDEALRHSSFVNEQPLSSDIF
jgi:dsRNA-specific ribonuclease